jgi:hypothetical protein
METVRIRDPGWKKVGSGINIPDPQHWDLRYVLSDLLPWTDSLGLQLNLGPVMPVLQLAQSSSPRVLHDVFNAHMLVLNLGSKRKREN